MAGKKSLVGAAVLAFCLLGGLALSWPAPPVQAGPGLPPRERPPSNEGGGHHGDGGDSAGAYIELQSGASQGKGWAVVQWQDSAGTWHDVEGWRGEMDANGSQRWWVAAKDFGTGPFRWGLKDRPEDQVRTASASFYLPARADETMRIEIAP